MKLIQTGTRIHLMHAYAPVIVTLAQMVASEEDVFVEESAVDRVRKLMEENEAHVIARSYIAHKKQAENAR